MSLLFAKGISKWQGKENVMFLILPNSSHARGITVFKIFTWGGISSHIRYKIYFYSDARAQQSKRDFQTYISLYTSPS